MAVGNLKGARRLAKVAFERAGLRNETMLQQPSREVAASAPQDLPTAPNPALDAPSAVVSDAETAPEPAPIAPAPIAPAPVLPAPAPAAPPQAARAPSEDYGMDFTPAARAGDRLRLAREAAGLSLPQVADRLRIRLEYVAALEDMNVKMLPGKAYALPYLRSYAKLLNLDPEALLSQFQAESALSREDATPQIHNPKSKPERERPWMWAVALAAVAAGFVVYRAIAPQGDTADDAAAKAAAAAPPAAAAGAQRPVARWVEGDGLPFGVAAQRVEIRAVDAGWLDVRTPNGTIMLSQQLNPGQVYQPDTGAGWTLHTKDGGVFEVYLNGVSVGLLGQPGAPVLGRQVDAIAAVGLERPLAAPAPEAPLLGAGGSGPVAPIPITRSPVSAGAGGPGPLPPALVPVGQGADPGAPARPRPRPRPAARPVERDGPVAALPPAASESAPRPAPAKTAPAKQPDSWEVGSDAPAPGPQRP
jgi:cytoskeleton protein RodZ